MTDSGKALFSTLVPLAMVVALSPMSVVPALLLVLHAPRRRPSGLAFFFGWLAGLTAVTAVFVQVPLLVGLDHSTPPWEPWVCIVIGAVLILVGLWRWVTRKPSAKSATWLIRMSSKVTPGTAAATGMVLAVINPKVLLITAAAGLAIGTAELSTPIAAGAIAGYAALAGSTVAVPILTYAAAAERIDPQLERVRAWIERHQSRLTTMILLVIAVVLLYTGVRGL
jgi:hypothetical protein